MTPEDQQFIRDMANDEWTDRVPDSLEKEEFDAMYDEWQMKTHRFLKECTDSEQLHLFADLYNWDGGIDDLQLLIQNENCELATALLIYWRAQPQEYIGKESISEYMPNFKPMLEEIQRKVINNDFTSSICKYNPADDQGDDYRKHIPPIPKEMGVSV